MVRVKRTDANQAAIVHQLEAWGLRVQSLHEVGQGVPDLLVGLPGFNVLVEVKVPGKKLNERQVEWHAAWPGTVIVASTAEEIVLALREEQELPVMASYLVNRIGV